MRILVTGGLGFLGSHLCARLTHEGHTVVAYDHSTVPAALAHARDLTATFPAHYRCVPGSILDPAHLSTCCMDHQPEAVIHLAAIPGVRSSVSSPLDCMRTNMEGTLNVLEACRETGVHKILFASSSSVYGHPERPGAPSCETDHADKPCSPYAASKRAGELLCHTYAHLHGMQIVCLRFFSVYGPRQRPDLAFPTFARQLLAGEPVTIFGDGSSQRDYTYIDDSVDGCVRALAALPSLPAPWTILNLGSGTPVVLQDALRLLATALGVPRLLAAHHAARPEEVDTTWAERTRARDLLGWVPQMPLAAGLHRFADWYMQQHS